MTAREVLLKAAEVLERDGWRQHDAGFVGQPRCVLGAMRQACLPELPGGAFADAQGALHSFIYDRGHSCGIVVWNDSPGRTADEVIAALRAAAGAAP